MNQKNILNRAGNLGMFLLFSCQIGIQSSFGGSHAILCWIFITRGRRPVLLFDKKVSSSGDGLKRGYPRILE